jgi:hypothetical protein
MDRQLHISRVIFVFLADGTERCYHWQNHDHDVFLFLRPPSRLQDLMQSLLYSGMCHMASARFTACLYWVQLISSPYLFIYYAFKAPVICYCLFFFFSRLRNPVGLEDRLSSDDYTILILASNGLIVWGVYKVNSESQSLSAFHFVICVFCSFQGGISRAACIQIPVSDRHLIECNGIEYA